MGNRFAAQAQSGTRKRSEAPIELLLLATAGPAPLIHFDPSHVVAKQRPLPFITGVWASKLCAHLYSTVELSPPCPLP